jgi:hypothetical protein
LTKRSHYVALRWHDAPIRFCQESENIEPRPQVSSQAHVQTEARRRTTVIGHGKPFEEAATGNVYLARDATCGFYNPVQAERPETFALVTPSLKILNPIAV